MKNKKQKTIQGMFLGVILIIILTITYLGVSSLLTKIETKSVDASVKTGLFWEDLVETYETAPLDYKTPQQADIAIKQAPTMKQWVRKEIERIL